MTKRQFPLSKNEHPKEDRYDILGKVGKVLFVVCTFKKGNIIHIISARRATEPENIPIMMEAWWKAGMVAGVSS